MSDEERTVPMAREHIRPAVMSMAIRATDFAILSAMLVGAFYMGTISKQQNINTKDIADMKAVVLDVAMMKGQQEQMLEGIHEIQNRMDKGGR